MIYISLFSIVGFFLNLRSAYIISCYFSKNPSNEYILYCTLPAIKPNCISWILTLTEVGLNHSLHHLQNGFHQLYSSIIFRLHCISFLLINGYRLTRLPIQGHSFLATTLLQQFPYPFLTLAPHSLCSFNYNSCWATRFVAFTFEVVRFASCPRALGPNTDKVFLSAPCLYSEILPFLSLVKKLLSPFLFSLKLSLLFCKSLIFIYHNNGMLVLFPAWAIACTLFKCIIFFVIPLENFIWLCVSSWSLSLGGHSSPKLMFTSLKPQIYPTSVLYILISISSNLFP